MSRSTTIYETDVYGTTPKIPAGYEAGEFRFPKSGETYLSAKKELGPIVFHTGDSVFGPRLILTKTPTRPPMPETAPEGYEFTGEYRKAVTEEYVQLSPLSAVDKWTPKTKTSDSYWILRPLPTPESVYGTKDVKAPSGYELGEFRKLVKGETVTYLSLYVTSQPTPITLKVGGYADKYVYTLKPIPTPADVYGCDPDAPKGYKKVEFRKLKVGEKARWINRIIPTATPIDVEVRSYDLDSALKGSGYVWIVEPIPAPAPAPKFKVGDRVRYKSYDGIRKATVTGHKPGNKWGDTLLRWDDVGNGANNEADMELDNSPIPPCPAPSGFRYSGEYRTPEFADIYLADGKNATNRYCAAVSTDNNGSLGPKHILVRA